MQTQTAPIPTLFNVLAKELRLRNYSHKTLKAYRSCLRSFIQHVAPKHPRDISNEEVRSYLLYLIDDKKLASATVNQVFNSLRFLYVELYKKPFVIGSLPRPKKEKKLPRILDQDEVLSIFKQIDNLKHRTILMLIYSAGLRIGESVSLKVSDIDSERKLIYLRSAKGKKDRYTILSDTILEMLREYYKKYKPTEYLFDGAEGRKHLSERSVQAVFERAVKSAKIQKNVTVHSLRHAFVLIPAENCTRFRGKLHTPDVN